MNRSHVSQEHLTSGQVAAILDERLNGSDREPALAHLAECAECRHEMAEMHRALHDRTRERRGAKPWLIVASGLAAALVLLLVPAGLERARWLPVVAAPTRAAGGVPVDVARPIGVVSPAEGAVVTGAATLTWRSAGSGASYIVTVQDTTGAVAWSSSFADTSISIPASAGLISGRQYFWSVDARLSDGASTTTGVRAFTVH